MAIIRDVAYVARVEGFDAAGSQLDKLDAAAMRAEGSVADAGEAAADLAHDYAAADAAAAGLADGLKATGAGAKKAADGTKEATEETKKAVTWTEALEKRVGFANKALTAFGLIGLASAVDGLINTARELYALTDAGEAAQLQTEATASSVDGMISLLTAQGDATKVTTEATLQLITAQIAQEVSSAGMRKTAIDLINTQRHYAEALKRVADEKAALAAHPYKDIIEVQNAYNNAISEGEKEIARLVVRLGDLTGEYETQQATLSDAAKIVTGVTDTINRHGKVATATLGELIAKFERIKAVAIDLDNLPAFDFGEAVGGADDLKGAVDELIPQTRSISALWTAATDAIGTTADAAGDIGGAFVQSYEEAKAAADLSSASHLGQIGQIGAAIQDTFGKTGADAVMAWATVASNAIDGVASALGSIKVAFDAIADAQMTGIDNAKIRADEELAEADAALRRAEEQAKAEGEKVESSAAVAAASKVRADAAEKAYKAEVRAAKAEEEAAEARKAFAVIDFAIKGANAVAASVGAFAQAALYASIPFGLGAASAAAATVAGVGFAAEAALYGVAAGVTAAAPTARSSRPEKPDSMFADTAKENVAAGDTDGKKGGDTVVHNWTFGTILGTTAEAQDAVIWATNEGNRRRGGARSERRGGR